MAKSLDGIRRLNSEDIKKYRKIVLSYIGEKDPAEVLEQKKSSPDASLSKRVDGVNLNKINRLAAKGKIGLKKLSAKSGLPPVLLASLPASPSLGGELGRSGSAARPIKPVSPPASPFVSARQKRGESLGGESEAERLKEAIKRQEEERKKIKEEERQYQMKKEQAEKDRREQAERQKQDKIRLAEELVRQEKIKQAEKERAEEAKKWEEEARLEEQKKEAKRLAEEKIRLEKEKVKQEKMKQIEIAKQKRELVEKKLQAERELIRQEELKKKAIADQAKREAEEKKRLEEIRQHEEKIKLEERKKEERRIVEENSRLEKIKREAERQKIKREIKAAKLAAKEKKKIKRQKAWRKIKRDFNLKLNILFSKIKQNIIYIISLLILFLAIIYIVFCLAVLRFGTDNNIIGRAASYLPAPAVITSQGIISYLDYKKIENNNYLSLGLADKKNYLAKWVILSGLKKKYGLPARTADEDLAIKYVLNKDFNQVGLSRINKINESLQGQSGIEQLGKYADEYNDGVYYSRPSAVEKFGPAVSGLAIGQTSDIIPRADGYYIVKRIDDKNGQLGLKYLFIGARTLDQYVVEKLENIKVFILAN